MNLIHHICRCMPNILYLMGSDFISYYTKIKISHRCRFHEILYQNQNISWLQIAWDITLEPKYFMVTDFMGYYTKFEYLIVADFMRYFIRIKIFHGCRFHEVLHHNQNNLCLHISWDIYQNGCRCHEIFHQNYYISLLQISWDITQESKYLMAADIMRY